MRIRSSWGGSPNIRAVQGAVSNARGRDFEDYLDRACQLYRSMGIANIEKTPEPFKCLKKNKGGRAIVQFIHHAQPDYKGVLLNGQAIIFEAKCTTKDRIQQSVLTQNQADMLRDYQRLGAYTAVCVGIHNTRMTQNTTYCTISSYPTTIYSGVNNANLTVFAESVTSVLPLITAPFLCYPVWFGRCDCLY